MEASALTFQYDTEGRLKQAFQTNATTQGGTYAYDAMNRLASRIVTSGSTTTTTLFIHDLADHIVAETNTAGTTLREYIWLNDIPIAVVDGVNTASPTLYYVHTDHLGRPIEAMSQSGATVWEALYRPFGETVSIFNAVGFGGIDLRFPGQWFQLENGLAYNWQRHYDASLGRYVQPDPIGLAGGRSLYGYVGQNPLAYTDPQGLFCVSFGSSTSCTFPNGPSFVVPRPTGFPDTLWGENPFSFHRYRVGRPIGSANPADIMRGIICKPTPGNPNPATNDGTQNNAVVLGQDDPVTSYLTSDLVTGEPLVVNISNSNSLFHAGYVVRYVRDGVAYTAGEGNNWMQSEWIPGQGFANELLWRGQLEEFIANPRKYCRCGG